MIKKYTQYLKSVFSKKGENRQKFVEKQEYGILEEMKKEDIEKIIKHGEAYLKSVELVKAYWYHTQQNRILDSTDPQYKDFDPRSLAKMLDESVKMDAQIIEIAKEIVK